MQEKLLFAKNRKQEFYENPKERGEERTMRSSTRKSQGRGETCGALSDKSKNYEVLREIAAAAVVAGDILFFLGLSALEARSLN